MILRRTGTRPTGIPAGFPPIPRVLYNPTLPATLPDIEDMRRLLFATLGILLLTLASHTLAAGMDAYEQGKAFLAENRTKEGVVTTVSGLQYKVLQPGKGTVRPTPSDVVEVHYHGILVDGTVFDSSVERGRPIRFRLTQVIRGWTEGLQKMVVGDKTRFFIPSNLAYDFREVGKIPPGSVLIFDVELLGIN